jgi:hypothetical protein
MQILRASIAFVTQHLIFNKSVHSDVELIDHRWHTQNVVDKPTNPLHVFFVEALGQRVTINGRSNFSCRLQLANLKVVNVNSDFVLNATENLAAYLLKQGWEPFVPPIGYAQPIPEAC